MSHYCKICGRSRPNEKFSGKGHAQHICKECAKLPQSKRNEMETINRLMDLPFRLSKANRMWLEKMRKDEREEVRSAAEWAWQSRFAPADVSGEEDEDLPSFSSVKEDEYLPPVAEDDDWNDGDLDDIDPDELPF